MYYNLRCWEGDILDIMRVRAFSIIELLVVIAVIAIVAAIAVPSYMGYVYKARINGAILITQSFGTKILNYYAKNGSFPSNPSLLGYPTVAYAGIMGQQPNCFTATASPGNAWWGSPYINTMCITATSTTGRLDIFMPVETIGVPVIAPWTQALFSQRWTVDANGVIKYTCFQGGGSPYREYFPPNCT
jgi:prepilin-type N-terminal cleavage/methylation domain-containing protein